MCKDCNTYKEKNHNYCRMCGYHIRKGRIHNVRIATAYNSREKFCGYCGAKKGECKC